MDHLWSPGESGNPNGRPLGSRNRRTKEIINQIIASGNKDPLLTLSDLQAKSDDEGIRATAANMLAPYLHSKLAAVPAPRYIEHEFTLPNINPTTEQEISANIAHLNNSYAAGTLDLESYQTMLAGQHQHINALKAREDIPANQDIHITGGLPSLPGTNITMPEFNGHLINGEILAPPEPRTLPDLDVDRDPVIPPDDNQHSTGGDQ
jgi:hypothetical protein